ncbi:hypothetical protein [Nostoc punctiforme]|uniref:Uncharacterized protein n=1 Tax=Nostoc punctiforme (strain ATCC 29133 / PCC 73102) TaxID=63737 RepID=B2JAR1_NOSP7|nr:hypothetical protein [Nostoc punctiforme]ACC85015.1 conserved hypothetical protein [Nostoc punctiforme PCC 73102]
MSTTIQQLFHKWAILAPDECLSTERDYKFKLRILPDVEKCNSLTASRQIITENLETHLANQRDLTIQLLNFVLLTIIQHCAARHSSISFSFTELGTIATICNGLRSQPHPHPAIAALDAYIQLLEF